MSESNYNKVASYRCPACGFDEEVWSLVDRAPSAIGCGRCVADSVLTTLSGTPVGFIGPVGMRAVVDYDDSFSIRSAKEIVYRFWENSQTGMSKRFKDQEEAINWYVSDFQKKKEPLLVTVQKGDFDV